jgi:hypothetical protein
VINIIISESTSSVHLPFAFNDPTNDAVDFDGSGMQLCTVPVGGADTVSVQFSEHMTNIGQNSLVFKGLALANLPVLAAADAFDYDPETHVARWLFEDPLPADQYVIVLDDALTGAAGDALDGEWTNPFSLTTINAQVSKFPSGDGTAGGDFSFVMTIIPGDDGLDNSVSGTDFLTWQQRVGGPGRTFTRSDFNGDGYVNGADLAIQNANYGIEWLELVYADFDNDGDVDSADLGLLTSNYNSPSATHAQGDADRDGDVDGEDFSIYQRQVNTRIDWVP